jgi:D-alanyl-D-alanine carboxypeptidase
MRSNRFILWPGAILFSLSFLVMACRPPNPSTPSLSGDVAQLTALPTRTETAADLITPEPPREPIPVLPQATATITPNTSPTPIFTGDFSPACGLSLPPLPPGVDPIDTVIARDPVALEALRDRAPATAWPAIQRLLDAPGTVGLVLYQAGREADGVFWNADAPMPLASVAKLVILVAFVEAVAGGEINPLTQVPLAELDRYYLPNFDLGAHRRAVAELRENGRILAPDSDNPSVNLEDVAWMMIRHSSNAASDYLHHLLGQERVETTALSLGLDASRGQSAPCTFLGQFLAMAHHIRSATSDRAALLAYLEDDQGGQDYGRDVALLFDAYSNQASFRAAEVDWRSGVRRPSIDTQRFFAEHLAVQGSPRDYAGLMSRLAQNGLSNADSSFQARRYLEWPMRFPVNQESFSNLGYKNGSLPGVLTTVYYGYRLGDSAPVVLALFYRDLPQQTYRRWRFDLPHDELARWLLAEPEAISLMAGLLSTPDS